MMKGSEFRVPRSGFVFWVRSSGRVAAKEPDRRNPEPER
jgi:hypothetical protein